MFPQKPKNKKQIYLDNAAATPTDAAVIKVMTDCLKKNYANPSTLYGSGVKARQVINTARKTVADLLFTQPETIIFTGGGTESINLAILGVARQYKNQGKHIITNKTEHHAVLHTMKQLEQEGFEITYLEVDEFGKLNVADLKKALRKDTILVSIMYANNEFGAIFPLADIGREILKWRKTNQTNFPYFHTDACQAAGYLDLNVEKLHVDLMSLNGSKIYGPKGTGVLFKKRYVSLQPIMYGGGQEYNLRPGTENTAGIVGFAKALELAQKNKIKNNKKVAVARDYFWKQIKQKIKDVRLIGPDVKDIERLSNNLQMAFHEVEAESLILYLDYYGIMCTNGSACAIDSSDVSLSSVACYKENDGGVIRCTLGKDITKKDIDYVMKYLPEIVKELRRVEKMR